MSFETKASLDNLRKFERGTFFDRKHNPAIEKRTSSSFTHTLARSVLLPLFLGSVKV